MQSKRSMVEEILNAKAGLRRHRRNYPPCSRSVLEGLTPATLRILLNLHREDLKEIRGRTAT